MGELSTDNSPISICKKSIFSRFREVSPGLMEARQGRSIARVDRAAAVGCAARTMAPPRPGPSARA